MQQFEQLEHGQFYHIYNHAVGERDLFRDANNYEYFLDLCDKHISSVAKIYAWVLMKNHFHLLVRIRNIEQCINLTGCENRSALKPLHQYFSNLFNAYTKAYNKYHKLSGALFERPFKRKLIDNKEYLKQVILYIHNNPVHHGLCSHPLEYPWTSYLSCISIKPTKLQREEVIGWFDDKANFKTKHGEELDFIDLESWLEFKTSRSERNVWGLNRNAHGLNRGSCELHRNTSGLFRSESEPNRNVHGAERNTGGTDRNAPGLDRNCH